MGLIKRNGYDVKGVALNQAYAKINRLYVERENNVVAYFGISNNRDNTSEPLEEISFECKFDKSQNVFEQVYIKAKEELFQGWEDDIPVVESET